MVEPMVGTLGRLGSRRVIAFHGHGGLDELALSGPSQVTELRDGKVTEWSLDPAELGFGRAGTEDVAGGSAEENAVLVRRVLAGEAGPRRDIVVLNAAAGLLAADLATDMAEGVAKAAEAVDSGRGSDALARLVEVSNRPL